MENQTTEEKANEALKFLLFSMEKLIVDLQNFLTINRNESENLLIGEKHETI